MLGAAFALGAAGLVLESEPLKFGYRRALGLMEGSGARSVSGAMVPTFTSGIVAGALVGATLGYGAIRRERHLDGKLRALRYVLFVLGAAILGLGIAIVSMERLPLPPSTSIDDVKAAALLAAVREHTDAVGQLLGMLCFIGAAVVVLVAHGFAELRPFVLAHRLDLAARDQAQTADSRPA